MSVNDLGLAIALFEGFHDGPFDDAEAIEIDFPEVVLLVGRCDGILYTADRGEGEEKYIHKFKASARPMLCSSPDGDQLLLLGGDFTFTENGIEDN